MLSILFSPHLFLFFLLLGLVLFLQVKCSLVQPVDNNEPFKFLLALLRCLFESHSKQPFLTIQAHNERTMMSMFLLTKSLFCPKYFSTCHIMDVGDMYNKGQFNPSERALTHVIKRGSKIFSPSLPNLSTIPFDGVFLAQNNNLVFLLESKRSVNAAAIAPSDLRLQLRSIFGLTVERLEYYELTVEKNQFSKEFVNEVFAKSEYYRQLCAKERCLEAFLKKFFCRLAKRVASLAKNGQYGRRQLTNHLSKLISEQIQGHLFTGLKPKFVNFKRENWWSPRYFLVSPFMLIASLSPICVSCYYPNPKDKEAIKWETKKKIQNYSDYMNGKKLAFILWALGEKQDKWIEHGIDAGYLVVEVDLQERDVQWYINALRQALQHKKEKDTLSIEEAIQVYQNVAWKNLTA